MTKIRHPQGPKEIAARDRLIQAALRPFPADFSVASEYPTVLSAQDVRFSWGLFSDLQGLVAHANLWPRVLLDGDTGFSMNVGLIGNVATGPASRGQGHMSHLLEHLVEKAKQDGLDALILWSDLSGFYQKRGFSSCSHEKRYLFRISDLEKKSRDLPRHGVFRRSYAHQLSPELLARSRFAVKTTLVRPAAIWAQLLGIPGLNLFSTAPLRDNSTAFLAIGKGCDLLHVVHEWGAPNPEFLLQGILAAGNQLGYEELLLLAPADLPTAWDESLRAFAKSTEIHPMALVRPLRDEAPIQAALGRAFIWGLDSI